MDFRKLSRAMPALPDHGNSTELPGLTDLPPNILEALVPGYSIISRYASAYLGVDISIFVTVGIIALATHKAGQYAYAQLERAFSYLFMCSVYIDQHDDLFDMVMAWMAANQQTTSRTSKMRAKTQRGTKAEDAFDAVSDDALDENGLFNYTKWSARTPPRYEPYYGRQYIWHEGKILWCRRSKRPNDNRSVQVSWGGSPEEDIVQLDCIGRNIEPIKDFLRTIRVWSLNQTRHTTTIRHPTPKDRARFSGTWSKTAARPSRPMDTVILDAEQKAGIIQDMNEYLHPASPKWYATRGIPYRRGYLFHGPPGTGKTSLSFALAGIFGLEIYAISLQEPALTEGDLMQLFNGLPRRCIVLLEDVDAAGLLRDGNSDSARKMQRPQGKDGKERGSTDNAKGEGKDGAQTQSKKDEDFTLKDLAKELKSLANPRQGGRGGRGGNDDNNNGPNKAAGTGISLSGLLNAIDGVATHEGRVLIMTTNHPEKLDAALIRPGRVDRRVEFKLAMKAQIRELFVRMYAASEERLAPVMLSQANGSPKQANGHAKGPRTLNADIAEVSRAELEDLAVQFAAEVPDATFTPAEVQNLLMRHKKSPREAVAEVKQWTAETLEEKERDRKAKEDEDAEEDEKDGR